MSRPMFATIMIAIVVLAFLGMWLAWRARARRDAGVQTSTAAHVGAVIAEFARVFYISTTPAGEPLVRVAAPGLRYRGRADIVVREDGVTLDIDGEQPVHLSAAQLRGSGEAGRRIGKAVEQGGLALIRWESAGEAGQARGILESSFRFDSKAEQQRFAAAIDQISHTSQTNESTHQEGAK